MAPESPTISLIVPAYNEADRIAGSLQAVSRFVSDQEESYELLVVNDGSRDDTAEIVRRLAPSLFEESRFELIEYGGNRGKGYAIKQGFLRARGEYLIFSDTDLSAPIDQIPKLVDVLEEGADMAIGSRRLPDSEVIGLPWPRRIMSLFFSLLSRVLVLPGIRDTQCGFKAYRAEVAKRLVSEQTIDGYTFDVEHLLLARKYGYRVEEVPVRWIYTEGSQVQGIRDSIRMFRDLLVLRNRVGRET